MLLVLLDNHILQEFLIIINKVFLAIMYYFLDYMEILLTFGIIALNSYHIFLHLKEEIST
ncbi:hypothetical protein CBFG_04324 [Clostridiales bacterium 1_7_47FAA]|nr:hypothetical protein CBFG_04324 [Clostridiales bacterium 1_7_47FAA]